jgi:predicted membrane protein
MFYLFFLLFVLLLAGLFFSVFKTGKLKTWAKIYRILIVTFATTLFTYYFVTKSLTPFLKNSLTVQLINTLPLPLDFYIIKVHNEKSADSKYETRHVGTIRSNFYRIDYLDMKKSDQFWIVGFMGKKNMVYFSQHALPNKNEDQIIEIHNYINQSAKLSEISKTLVT